MRRCLPRLEANTLTADDRRVLGKVLTSYFWLLFALREAKLSLKRLKALVFGEKPKPPKPPVIGWDAERWECGRRRNADERITRSASLRFPIVAGEEAAARAWAARRGGLSGGADGRCRHEELAVGERCPACGRGQSLSITAGRGDALRWQCPAISGAL